MYRFFLQKRHFFISMQPNKYCFITAAYPWMASGLLVGKKKQKEKKQKGQNLEIAFRFMKCMGVDPGGSAGVVRG